MRTNRCRAGLATLVVPSAIAIFLLASAAIAHPARALSSRDVASEPGGFYNPTAQGGSWLTLAVESATAPLGEPVNVVISNVSDPRVLTEEGFLDYARSLNFSTNCGGILLGGTQSANLGDGMGMQQQVNILREDFGNLAGGTCEESLNGGNHIRLWRQNGTTANSGAWFLAASKEENATLHHMIIPDGYDLGRDNFVQRAVSARTVSPTSGRIFSAAATNVSGNGYFADVLTSEINHGISTDGIVAVLTVNVLSAGNETSSATSSASASSAAAAASSAGSAAPSSQQTSSARPTSSSSPHAQSLLIGAIIIGLAFRL